MKTTRIFGFALLFLSFPTTAAFGQFVGVDSCPPAQATPTNWTSINAQGTFNNLIDESGSATNINLEITGIVGGAPG